jgi:hypothetical protein
MGLGVGLGVGIGSGLVVEEAEDFLVDFPISGLKFEGKATPFP